MPQENIQTAVGPVPFPAGLIYYGSGAPSFPAVKGSLYIRSDGSSSSTRAYICSVASGTWVSVTTSG
jgi:hypothetical protein